jgi:hypothetical protein
MEQKAGAANKRKTAVKADDLITGCASALFPITYAGSIAPVHKLFAMNQVPGFYFAPLYG